MWGAGCSSLGATHTCPVHTCPSGGSHDFLERNKRLGFINEHPCSFESNDSHFTPSCNFPINCDLNMLMRVTRLSIRLKTFQIMKREVLVRIHEAGIFHRMQRVEVLSPDTEPQGGSPTD